jgi:putative adenylate-forming enzyme
VKRLRVLGHYLRAKRQARFASREALEDWQEEQMQAFLAKVLPRSPYYRARIQPARWREAALTDKKSMMRHFDALNTVGLKKKDALRTALRAERERDWAPSLAGVSVGLSSGTSGHRGIFLASEAEREAWAGQMLARALPTPLWREQRIALFLRSNSNLYQSLGGGRLRFEYFDIQADLDAQAKRLKAFDPTVLAGPPSVLRRLAESGLRLKLQRVFSVAETLEDLDRRRIEAAWGLPLHQIYQATEGFIGISCRFGTVHLNEDVMVVQKEWLDEPQGRFVPLISDFRRLSQPILRYRLNDVLTVKRQPCACGSVFTAIEAIEGRQDDLFYFRRAAGPGLKAVYADHIRRAFLQASAGIQDYRATQRSPKLVTVAVQCPPAQRQRVQAGIRREFKVLAGQFSFQAPTLRFTDRFEVLGTRKLSRLRRLFAVKG